MAKVLCPPSDLYMPVHSMCSNHCIAFDVSSATVTETGFLADTDLDENLHLATTLKISCRISRRKNKNRLKKNKIWENSGEATVLLEVFRNSGCVLVKLDCGLFSLFCQDSMVMESVFIEIYDNTFKHL